MKKSDHLLAPLIQSRFYPWLVWGLAAAFFFSEYIARVAPGVMVPDLMRDFHLTAFTVSVLSSYFYYAYTPMQIPVGILIDRFGSHRLLTGMILVAALGCLLFASTHDIMIAQIGRLLLGFGSAFAFVGTLKLAATWFPASRFGLLSGLTQALGMLGAAAGQVPVSFSVSLLGWRNTLWGIALIFIILALGIAYFVRDKPPQIKNNVIQFADKGPFLSGLRAVLANPQSWYNAMYAGLLYAPTAAFAELWGVTFLERAYGLTPHMAATGVALIFVGWGIGGPLVGSLSDYLRVRRPIMLFSAGASLVLISLIVFVPHLPLFLLFSLLFLYGIANTGVATAYAVSTEINPRSIAGTSVAFANMGSILIAPVLQPLIGFFLERHWNGQMQEGVAFYSAGDFRFAMIFLPISLLCALLLVRKIRETHCQIHS